MKSELLMLFNKNRKNFIADIFIKISEYINNNNIKNNKYYNQIYDEDYNILEHYSNILSFLYSCYDNYDEQFTDYVIFIFHNIEILREYN